MLADVQKIIVIGASLGGIEALKTLVADLPADLPAALLVVLHVGSHGVNSLDQILSQAGPLPASNAVEGEPIRAAHIYVAPADRHLLVNAKGRLSLSQGPKENRSRPAIDPLFRSAAVAFGPKVIGVVLTGWLDDGTAGLWAVKEQGGVAVVQHPEDAMAPDMPLNALKHVEVNHCVPLKKIAPLLINLTVTAMSSPDPKTPEKKSVAETLALEVDIARAKSALERVRKLGKPSVFACPECSGVLLKIEEGGTQRFRCHTGHAYSQETLLADLFEQAEDNLWKALRGFDEIEMLLSHLALENPSPETTARLGQKAENTRHRADLVRQALRPESANP